MSNRRDTLDHHLEDTLYWSITPAETSPRTSTQRTIAAHNRPPIPTPNKVA